MSIAAPPIPLPPQATVTDQLLFRLSVERYHEMIESGILTADDPAELVEGVLVYKMPKNSSHATAVRKCRHALQMLLPVGYFYDAEQPITLPDGEPEPDGMIVAGHVDDFSQRHPGPADVALVIEVADSTLNGDRNTKLRSYARAGIGVYWIVNLIDRQVEHFVDPDPTGRPTPGYRQSAVYRPGEVVPLRIGERVLGEVAVSELLPPAD